MSANHAPKEERTNTVQVTCAATGPEEIGFENESYRQTTLADVEAWCAELRRLGATGDLVLPGANGLDVTIDLASGDQR